MKLFKKFLLAAGLVGLVGSFGFATQAKAETITATIGGSVDKNNVVTWWYTSDYADSEVMNGKIDVYVGKTKVGTHAIPADFEPCDDPTDLDQVDTFLLDTVIADSDEDLTDSLSGKVTLKISKKVDEDDFLAEGTLEGKIVPWYYVKVSAANPDQGTVKLTPDDVDYYEIKKNNTYLVKEDEDVTINATPETGFVWDSWSGLADVEGSSSKQKQTITVIDEFSAVANFKANGDEPVIGNFARLSYTIRNSEGTTVDSDVVMNYDISTTAKVGYTITLTSSGTGTIYNSSNIITDGKVISLDKEGSFAFYVKGTNGYSNSASLKLKVEGSEIKETKISIEGEKYMTAGYEIELNTKIDTEGTYYKNDVEWEITDGKAELSTKTTKYDKDKKEKVKVKFTGDTPDAGKTATIKLRARIPKAKNGVDPAEATYEITVYPKTTMSYSTSDRTLSYKGPAKVNTGTTDGQDSDNKDNTKTAIDSIGGIVIQVFSGDTSLGRTTSTKSNGASATISASTVEQMVYNLSSKLSGDSPSIKFRGFSCANDSNATYNKNVYADATTTAYRVEISYTKADGTSATEVVYGLEGQSIDITKISALKNATIQGEDGKSVTTIKVSSSPSNNRYTAVLGERKSASDGEGLDRVPKTGQNNAFVYVMVAIVACAVCGGLYAYNKKSKNL